MIMTQPTLSPPQPEQDALHEQYERILYHLWDLAYIACDEIVTLHPDLVVVLYHSGQAVLRATQATWSELHTEPFPPVVCTNLGLEKLARYNALSRELRCQPFLPFTDLPPICAHFMAWVAAQTAWQVELKAQTRATLGEDRAPERILILDDFCCEGSTRMSAMSLLHQIYPNAEIHFLAGLLDDWKTPLAHIWLHEHHPEVYTRMEADAQVVKRERAARTQKWVDDFLEGKETWDMIGEERPRQRHCLEWASQVALGTEDVDPESLAWRPLTPDSAAIAPLLSYLPAETWLTMSEAVYTLIEQEMQQRVHAQAVRPQRVPGCGIAFYPLIPEELMLQAMWQRRRLTRSEVVALTSLPPHQATRLLKRWVAFGFLVRRGRGRGSYYEISYTCGILAYGELPADPDGKIAADTEGTDAITTPFPVEFAHASISRAGAPTLAPVPKGFGASVPARILLIRPEMAEYVVEERLNGHASHPANLTEADPNGKTSPAACDKTSVKTLHDLAGIPTVFATYHRPDIKAVLRRDLTAEEKAEELAKRAVLSVTPETYAQGTDGIRYLEEALRQAIRTPLTEAYRAAILHLADDAPDLETARRWIAEKIPPQSS